VFVFCSIITIALAGISVIVVLAADYSTSFTIVGAAIAGFLLSLPISRWWLDRF
tara:strand:- start:12492 stop:12653 length:162 start_codon:yes stop_codon:yes gene_type:complete